MAAAAMGRQRRRARRRAWSVWARPGSEVAALLATALVGVIAALGWLADAAARLAPRAPLARAPRDGAAGGRRAVGGRHRALARLGSRLSGPGRERPHAGRRARRDRAADADA